MPRIDRTGRNRKRSVQRVLDQGNRRSVSHNGKSVRMYQIMAEDALGKPLPKGAHVHHVTDNQLVICQDAAYHYFIERRQRAFYACGHVNWKKCPHCKQWGSPETEDMYVSPDGVRAYHRKCARKYDRRRRSA